MREEQLPENEMNYKTIDERREAIGVIKTHEHKDAMVEMIMDEITNDHEATYYGFDINLNGRFERDPVLEDSWARRRAILQSCEMTTVGFFPGSSTAKRHKPQESFGLIVLPATKGCPLPTHGPGCQKYHKVFKCQTHVHGFIRCPNCLIPMPTSGRMTIYEGARPKEIEAPLALVAFANALKVNLESENLWIANEQIDIGRFVALSEPKQKFNGLKKYLARRTRKEQRLWDDVDFLPHRVFKTLRERIDPESLDYFTFQEGVHA